MNNMRQQLLESVFTAGNAEKFTIESTSGDVRLDVIPDANLWEVFSLVKMARRNNFTKPLTPEEMIEAWE